jgi:Uma2 family endonuclease
MATTARKLTYADYERMPADGFRHEIIDGEEFLTPAPNLDHQTVVGNTFRLIANHVAARKLGRVFVAPTDVVLSGHDIVEPDVIFVSEKRGSILKEKNIEGAPDLVIEVLSLHDRGRSGAETASLRPRGRPGILDGGRRGSDPRNPRVRKPAPDARLQGRSTVGLEEIFDLG